MDTSMLYSLRSLASHDDYPFAARVDDVAELVVVRDPLKRMVIIRTLHTRRTSETVAL